MGDRTMKMPPSELGRALCRTECMPPGSTFREWVLSDRDGPAWKADRKDKADIAE
jgi:hypothetical protein